HYIQNILDERPHLLSMEEEALLAGASEIFAASSNTFSILNNADLQFPTVQNAEGETIQLSHAVYDQLMESVDPSVREAAFKGL
ncbi:oligoendopeptidase F, partial [Enterococcus faecalis]